MTHPVIPRQDILDRLLAAFREHGYDGASIARLSAATGLGKASLYHHFKGGKQDMAEAVLIQSGGRFSSLVIAPLRATGDPRRRLRAMTAGLSDFYARGQESCLLELFGIGPAGERFRPRLKGAIHRFQNALASVLEEAGVEGPEAASRAEDAIVALQGALVVGRATGDRSVFQRVLERLPDRLLGPG
jgi:AcrR family transcriptional regulator